MKKSFGLVLIGLALLSNWTHAQTTPQGALISTDFTSEVGYNLDEIPGYALADAKNYVMTQVTEAQWEARAKMQIFATLYRQVFRVYYFSPLLQLTLPPMDVWRISMTSAPVEKTIQGHAYIVRSFEFYSVLVGSAQSINASEPSLNSVGGTFKDAFIVPSDPEHVFQRSGYACADESTFSLDTVTSENFLTYFDQECRVEPYLPIANRTVQTNLNCHWTDFPKETCLESLSRTVGFSSIEITWTRLPWNSTLADEYRVGAQTSQFADMEGVTSKLVDEINVGYKFIEPSSCTLIEGGSSGRKGCVNAPGWRQLLKFTSSSVNIGKTDLHLGDVLTPEYLNRGVYEYDPCHLHYHFQHYENYLFGTNATGRKTGFCLQTTWRYHNNEYTGFNTPYSFCSYQGISVGWGDDYYAGLDCQWIDVTNMAPANYDLRVVLNPDMFICEGVPILSTNGSLNWIPTNFTSSSNKTVYREACNFTTDYNANNVESYIYNFIGINSIVTMPCKRQATLSPTKDCGFRVQYDNLKCTPGQSTEITVENIDTSVHAVVRVCETSVVLGHSIACEYIDKLANEQIQAGKKMLVKFTCPGKRSATEPGGLYSILVAPLMPYDNEPNVVFTDKVDPVATLFEVLVAFIKKILSFIAGIFS